MLFRSEGFSYWIVFVRLLLRVLISPPSSNNKSILHAAITVNVTVNTRLQFVLLCEI